MLNERRRPGRGDRHDQPGQRRHRGDGRVRELRAKSQYNLAADGHRQPGSTFKAIDLADALSRGIDPNSTYYVSHTLAPGWLPGYPTYEVKTFEGTSQNKSINLVQATLASDNTVYAQLAADLGESTVTEMAHKMGVDSPLDSYAAEALGGLKLGVTPLEMANVYATLADGGWRNTPIAITKVVFPDGHVDTNWGQPHRVKVLSEGVTGEETRILHENVLGGTAGALGDQLPDGCEDGHDQRTRRRLARRLQLRILDGRVDGLPDAAGLDDRRARRAPAGRLPAGGNLARLHGGGDRRPPVRRFPQPNRTGITFQPFYGKYAATGLAADSHEDEAERAQQKPSHHRSRPSTGNGPASRRQPRPHGEPPAGEEDRRRLARVSAGAAPAAAPRRRCRAGSLEQGREATAPPRACGRIGRAWRRRTRLNSRAR